MYLKKLLLMFCVLGLFYTFSVNAYAAPTGDESTFYDAFSMDEDQVEQSAVDGDLGIYSRNAAGGFVLTTGVDLGLEDLNDYGFFDLTKGFSRMSGSTFADSKALSGKGDATTVVGANVFYLDSEGNMVGICDSIQTIGSSGIYNETLKLKIGENHVVIAAKKGSVVYYRLFKVVVKQEETKGMLENIQINFMPSGTTTSGSASSTFSLSDLQVFNSLQE